MNVTDYNIINTREMNAIIKKHSNDIHQVLAIFYSLGIRTII